VVKESLLELAGGHPAAGIDFAAFLQPDLCETDCDPAKQAQCKSSLGVADPAVVFAQSDVQSVMQAALDDPIMFRFTKIWEKIIVIIREKWTECILINKEWLEPRSV